MDEITTYGEWLASCAPYTMTDAGLLDTDDFTTLTPVILIGETVGGYETDPPSQAQVIESANGDQYTTLPAFVLTDADGRDWMAGYDFALGSLIAGVLMGVRS